MAQEQQEQQKSYIAQLEEKRRNTASALFFLLETPLPISSRSPSFNLERQAFITGEEIRLALSSHFNLPPLPRDAKPHDLLFSDAKLLLLPLRTMRGIFTWFTTVERLQQFAHDFAGSPCSPRWNLPAASEHLALANPKNACVEKKRIYAEEFALLVQFEPRLSGIGIWLANNALPYGEQFKWWRIKLARDLVVIPEAQFRDLLALNLLRTPTVLSGLSGESEEFNGPNMQTFLPRECLLYSLVDKSLQQKQLELNHLFFGDSRIGYSRVTANGICRVRLLRHAKSKPRQQKKRTKDGVVVTVLKKKPPDPHVVNTQQE